MSKENRTSHGWKRRFNANTPEGKVESAQRFAEGVRGGHRRREVRIFGWLLFGAPIAIFALAVIVGVLTH